MKTTALIGLLILVLVTACGGESADLAGAPSSPALTGAPADQSANTTPPDFAANSELRVVINSSIDLQVPDLRDAYSVIGMLARSYGGFIADGSIDQSAVSDKASLRLRVPADRHDEALTALRGLDGAEVKGEKTNAREITEEYTDLQSRLLNLKNTEAQYQQLLARAQSIQDILTVTAKIDEVRGEIDKAQGRINLLSNQSDYATILVNLRIPVVATTPPPPEPAELPSPVTVFTRTMSAAWDVTHAVVNIAVVLAVAAGWLLPVAIVSVVAWRTLGRRLRTLGARIFTW